MGYAIHIWLQTIGALLALGLAGGGVIRIFWNSQRPFLWLAAPLAGLPVMAGGCLLVYHLLPVSLPAAMLVTWTAAAAATLWWLFRNFRKLPEWQHLAAGVAVLLLGSTWAMYACNWTSLQAGEPTIAVADGSDMFGYSMVGDWLMVHQAAQPPGPTSPLEVLQFVNLFVDGSRWAAFYLTAMAGWVRGTTCLFSYDWFSGVALAAAIIGLAGLFSARRRALFLLFLVGLTAAWLTTSRSGFLGKTLGFPGALLMMGLYLETWMRPSKVRVLAACLLAPVASYLIHPVVSVLVLGLACGGVVLASLLTRWQRVEPLNPAPAESAGRAVLRAVALYLAMAGPGFVWHRVVYNGLYPPYVFDWIFTTAVSLDLESPSLALVGSTWSAVLVAVFLATTLALSGLAIQRRNVLALACLASAGLVPVAVLLGQRGLFGFHGLLYPIIAAGAAMLIDANSGQSRRRAMLAPTALLGLLVALHIPQLWFTTQRFLKQGVYQPMVYRESEVKALKKRIGTAEVDLCAGHYADANFVITELFCRGVRVHLRSPGWNRALAAWAARGTAVRGAMPPKARYSIRELRAYAPLGSRRYATGRLKLSEDGNGVTFVSVSPPALQDCIWDAAGRPGYTLSADPVKFDIHNGTGNVASVVVEFLLERTPEAKHLPTVFYASGSLKGEVFLKDNITMLKVPLQLPPGITTLEVLRSRPVDAATDQTVVQLARYQIAPSGS